MNIRKDNRIGKGLKNIIVKLGLVAALGILFLGVMLGTNVQKAEAHSHMAKADTESVIREVFGPHADSALRIANCESTMNPDATNGEAVSGSNAAGLFQILYPSTWNSTSQAGNSPYDVEANVKAAYEIFARDGFSWQQWECRS